MGFRRYVAPTAREALERIRKELGVDAVILSNRMAGPNRVEIIAAAQGQMNALVEDFVPAAAPASLPPSATRKAPRPAPAAAPARRAAPESFQEFIRRQSADPASRNEGVAMYHQVAREMEDAPPRALSNGGIEMRAATRRPDPAPWAPAVVPPPRALPAAAADAAAPAVFRRRPSRLDAPARALPPVAPQPPAPPPEAAATPRSQPVVSPPAALAPMTQPPPAAPAPAPVPAPVQPVLAAAAPAAAPAVPREPAPEALLLQGTAAVAQLPDSRLMAELQSLRSTLNDRISRLEVRLAQAEPAPASSAPVASPIASAAVSAAAATGPGEALTQPTAGRRQVMTRLIMSGFSPQLSRRVGDAAPASLDAKGTDAWLQQVIGQYVRCPADVDNPLLAPGAVALVGPTGVGKTTTIAKIAARFVVRHGASALGLVTLDSYRMGAHEQLRGYGRILGVPVHVAHDAASLREMLASLQGRRQILIDTCGMSQRDPRLGEMLAMLDDVRFDGRAVRRVLLINAASHAETLDEVARGWRVDSAHGAILTKIDEAARIGGALDALMRFQTPLLGLTNGQRVPEDWHPGNPPLLAHIALKPFGAAFSLDSDELQALARTGALIA